MSGKYHYKVHPIAALFPMLSEQELRELAEDIKANGLQQAIMLDKEEQIVDGRNRLAACEIAKITPKFETLNGIEPEAYIISQNLARRHMTGGQRAMVAAKIYPDPEKGGIGKGNTLKVYTHFPMVERSMLAQARRILRDAPDLAPGVIAGTTPFDRATREAKDRQDLASSKEHKMAMLRDGARDLAELVKEGMDIDEALAAMKERERKIREAVEHGKQAAETGLSRFLLDVASIIAAVKLTEEKLLDKKKVVEVVKAAHQLQSLL
jgi:hypothetical protein